MSEMDEYVMGAYFAGDVKRPFKVLRRHQSSGLIEAIDGVNVVVLERHQYESPQAKPGVFYKRLPGTFGYVEGNYFGIGLIDGRVCDLNDRINYTYSPMRWAEV